jgi:hypothetical protein
MVNSDFGRHRGPTGKKAEFNMAMLIRRREEKKGIIRGLKVVHDHDASGLSNTTP